VKIIAVCAVVVVAAASVAAAKEAGVFNSGLPVNLPAPSNLGQQTVPTYLRLATGRWIKGAAVRFSVSSSSADRGMRLQVELVKNGAAPSGRVTATEPTGSLVQKLTIHHLATGTYRWWARLYNGKAVSPWKSFSSGVAFGIDTIKPSPPAISSPTDPVVGKVYRAGDVRFTWSATDIGSGVSNYWYAFSSGTSRALSPKTRGGIRTRQTTVSFKELSTGSYALAVAARDRAGNWSPVSWYHVRLDSTAPTVSAAGFSTFAFNPRYTAMTMNYLVTLPSWVHIGIYRASDNHLVRFVVRQVTRRNELMHYTWHGRNNYRQIVQPGTYNFFVRTTDIYHNTSIKEYSGLSVLNKLIVVSLSQQRLWAYQGHRQLLTSLVTTGNPLLPTPRGTFTILGKWHPFTFISPWPTTDWRYYPPSPVQYAMLFRVGGFYIHDAPWRTTFGPGTNSTAGKPGYATTGTHGCVNVPLSVATALFYWAPDGTTVRVVR
jgi:lipoprotein-anchoring transpeptidase ErfK/SrfK